MCDSVHLVRVSLDGPGYESTTHGHTHFIDASAIHDGAMLHVFLTNRSMDDAAEVCVAPADVSRAACERAELLSGPAAGASNDYEDRDVVTAQSFREVTIQNGQACCPLPPLSFAAITFRLG